MLLGKVGNKSIAFINHKPFHPGNLQNLEKVWQAEEKAAEEKKRQKELLEQRNHEVQIEELRKALREKEHQQSLPSKPSLFRHGLEVEDNTSGGLQKDRRKRRGGGSDSRPKRQKVQIDNGKTFSVQSIYQEDVHSNGHKSVWGSFYHREEAKWGYACCQELVRSDRCRKHLAVV